jgi:hypothetical protein
MPYDYDGTTNEFRGSGLDSSLKDIISKITGFGSSDTGGRRLEALTSLAGNMFGMQKQRMGQAASMEEKRLGEAGATERTNLGIKAAEKPIPGSAGYLKSLERRLGTLGGLGTPGGIGEPQKKWWE